MRKVLDFLRDSNDSQGKKKPAAFQWKASNTPRRAKKSQPVCVKDIINQVHDMKISARDDETSQTHDMEISTEGNEDSYQNPSEPEHPSYQSVSAKISPKGREDSRKTTPLPEHLAYKGSNVDIVTEYSTQTTTPYTETTKPTLSDADSFQRAVEMEAEIKLMNAWVRTNKMKKVPRRSLPPNYMKEPLDLMWVETETHRLRKWYNKEKYKNFGTSEPFKSRVSSQSSPGPMKVNRAYELRNAYVKNQPISSSYFERHFKRFNKPPFRNVNVKFSYS